MDTTSSHNLYGYCPTCGAPGLVRERRIDGNDACTNGHSYRSSDAVEREPRNVSGMFDSLPEKVIAILESMTPDQMNRVRAAIKLPPAAL